MRSGRAAKQIETGDHLIVVEWLIPKEEPNRASGPSNWGGGTPARQSSVSKESSEGE